MSVRANKTKIVAAEAANVTLTANQSDSVHLLNVATGLTVTLPAATAAIAGTQFKFVAKTSVTSNNYTIQGASSSDLFYGGVAIVGDANSPYAKAAKPNGSSHYKIVMAGTTTGGLTGTTLTLTCIGLNAWLVEGTLIASGTVTDSGVFA